MESEKSLSLKDNTSASKNETIKETDFN